MSALKKLLPGKKKSKKSSSASLRSATSEPNVADGLTEIGYRNVKEKDLPKLHKAAWNGDLAKVKQLTKKGDINQMDKQHRLGSSSVFPCHCFHECSRLIILRNERSVLDFALVVFFYFPVYCK